MQLQFLGTGAAMPTGHRYQSGVLVSAGTDRVLIDCGSGVLQRLPRTEAGYEGVDALLLTHLHLDHVSDVLPLLKGRWLAGADPLPIVGPEGTRAHFEAMLDIHSYLDGEFDLDVRDLGGSFELAGFDVEAFETRHSMLCHAYRLTPRGLEESAAPTVTVSGDTEAFEELIRFAGGSDALVHECAFPDDVSVSNHTRPSDLAAVLGDSDVGAVYLTHLYPHTRGRHREIVSTIREQYDGPVAVATDGTRVAL